MLSHAGRQGACVDTVRSLTPKSAPCRSRVDNARAGEQWTGHIDKASSLRLVPVLVLPLSRLPLTHMTDMERCEVARCRKVSPVMGCGAALDEAPGPPASLVGPTAAVAAMCSSTVGQRQRFEET